jgi:hypothetical protein
VTWGVRPINAWAKSPSFTQRPFPASQSRGRSASHARRRTATFTGYRQESPASVRWRVDADKGTKKHFTTERKSAVFLKQAIDSAPRCGICHARVHKNSISIDHIKRREDGGLGNLENAQLAHPSSALAGNDPPVLFKTDPGYPEVKRSCRPVSLLAVEQKKSACLGLGYSF